MKDQGEGGGGGWRVEGEGGRWRVEGREEERLAGVAWKAEETKR